MYSRYLDALRAAQFNPDNIVATDGRGFEKRWMVLQ